MADVTNESGLLPCPFCGREPRVASFETESLWSHDQVTYTKVFCDECDVGFDTEPGHELQAAEAWNTRALISPAGEVGGWLEPALIEHLRSLGCKCPEPLIGYRPKEGPRCRLCNVEPAAPRGMENHEQD